MDDEAFEGHQNGRPKRHDGRDPWSLLTRDAVAAEPEARAASTVDLGREVGLATAGDAVAVMLKRERDDTQGRYEEIWLEVTGVDASTTPTTLQAVFDSQPTYVRGVSSGDALTLTSAQILAVRPRRVRSSRPS